MIGFRPRKKFFSFASPPASDFQISLEKILFQFFFISTFSSIFLAFYRKTIKNYEETKKDPPDRSSYLESYGRKTKDLFCATLSEHFFY